jgi:pyruvate dehydrogenase E1 component beta subunit
MRKRTYAQALNEALIEEMERDDTVYVAGEDVGTYGGIFGVTVGLLDRFGQKRVKDTPISETAIVGSAVGAAATGLRPVVELMMLDFATVCMDQIVNQAAKMRYMFGGKAKLPIVLRAEGGAGFNAAAQHSQCLEAWFVHIPGLKVVMPSTPYDAKGLLKSSIRDDNPVIFIEHKVLYDTEGEVPDEEYVISLGTADIKREGADVTLVAYSMMVRVALDAAEKLQKEGISAEVIDPRTLYPLDKTTILDSVGKTHKLVILQEAPKTCGFGAEIAAIVADEAFDQLDAPIKRVAAPDSPVPFSPPLEKFYIPDKDDVIKTVKEII